MNFEETIADLRVRIANLEHVKFKMYNELSYTEHQVLSQKIKEIKIMLKQAEKWQKFVNDGDKIK